MYQPTNLAIGNSQLGTEAEFKALCAEAKSMELKL